ncbi:hypothetical protein [Actinokineospora cianjurensis]|uniref:Lipoprotein n=1 Tax=Actinokineospora cianjurensis TaxID=585224 RepID=A0A421B805_9PSEU|nr:hypothetical protein [Actinokineospora cianjurensis]RLK60438.1 hypothetical protein CLV68_0942 [Actinokineospora cianjurensis]
MALAFAVLLVAGCAEAKPTSVSPQFQDAVTALVRAAGGTADPSFTAMTCGSIFDGDPDASVAMWGDVDLAASPDDLLTAAVSLGWQPQVPVDDWSVLLVGPADARVGLRRGHLRAEKAKCSISGRHQDLTMPLRPDLTDAQRAILGPSFARATTAARKISTAANVPADEDAFPTAGTLSTAVLHTCATPTTNGAQWRATSKTPLTPDADLPTIKRAAIDALTGWKIDPRPTQPEYFTATRDDTTLSAMMTKSGDGVLELTLTATTTTCAPVK